MKTKFDILDTIFWFNTALRRFESGQVRGIRIMPTDMHKDESGKDILDGYAVLYQTEGSQAVFENEAFETEEQAREFYCAFFHA